MHGAGGEIRPREVYMYGTWIKERTASMGASMRRTSSSVAGQFSSSSCRVLRYSP
jgi:hypothetical protein